MEAAGLIANNLVVGLERLAPTGLAVMPAGKRVSRNAEPAPLLLGPPLSRERRAAGGGESSVWLVPLASDLKCASCMGASTAGLGHLHQHLSHRPGRKVGSACGVEPGCAVGIGILQRRRIAGRPIGSYGAKQIRQIKFRILS